MFNENSITAEAWVRQIKEGTVAFDDVPILFNLRDVVYSILSNN